MEQQQASGVRVERVVDGDTVVLSGVGTTQLLGVDAPDEGRCGHNAATRFTRSRLEGKRVKFELGEGGRDTSRRTLAYLRRGGTMHNLALVEEGYAKALTTPPNDKYADRFKAAEEEAKQQEAGPQETCARKRRQAVAGERARARERAGLGSPASSALRTGGRASGDASRAGDAYCSPEKQDQLAALELRNEAVNSPRLLRRATGRFLRENRDAPRGAYCVDQELEFLIDVWNSNRGDDRYPQAAAQVRELRKFERRR